MGEPKKDGKVEEAVKDREGKQVDEMKKRIETLEEEVKTLREQVSEWRNKYLYTLAELDNRQKQFIKERSRAYQKGVQEVLMHILEVVDDLEHARKSLEEARDVEAVRSGLLLILQKVSRVLESFGVEEISPEGERFDPLVHEAFGRETVTSKEKDQKIIRVVQKGYRIGENILRHPRVIVGVYEGEKGEKEG